MCLCPKQFLLLISVVSAMFLVSGVTWLIAIFALRYQSFFQIVTGTSGRSTDLALEPTKFRLQMTNRLALTLLWLALLIRVGYWLPFHRCESIIPPSGHIPLFLIGAYFIAACFSELALAARRHCARVLRHRTFSSKLLELGASRELMDALNAQDQKQVELELRKLRGLSAFPEIVTIVVRGQGLS